MKKFLIVFGLVLGFASAVYANGHFCCGGGCINPDGNCCPWCPSAEVCTRMGKCQKIVNGCYDCVECPEPNPCTENQCMNEDGVCCNSCPRTCPEGEYLINVDGCYQCGIRNGGGIADDDDDDDDDDDEIPQDPCEGVICDNCCSCRSDLATGTWICDENCTTTAEKPECCNNTAYAPCPEGKVRNAETCACECSASKCQEVYGDNYECCQNECVEFCQEAEIRDMTTCDCCSEKRYCNGKCCPETTPECCKGACYADCPAGQVRNFETCECGEDCSEGSRKYIRMDMTKTIQGGTSIWDAAVNVACQNVYDNYQSAPITDCCKNSWDIKEVEKRTETLNTYVPGYGEIACVIVTVTKNDCVCEAPKVVCGEECCAEGKECQNGRLCCDKLDKSKCPNGETMMASDGCEICKCDSPTSCPDGQVPVKNYVNGTVCGTVCCGMKVDANGAGCDRSVTCGTDNDYAMCDYSTLSGYKLAGAVNGKCCGGYTTINDAVYDHWCDRISDNEWKEMETPLSVATFKYDYDVFINGGVAYCAESTSNLTVQWSWIYTGPSTWTETSCNAGDDECYSYTCTAEVGDPYYGVRSDGRPCN